jgi:hypothetical protein
MGVVRLNDPDPNSFAGKTGGFAGLDQSFQYQSKL